MKSEILTVKELVSHLKLTEKTAYRLVANGKIPGFKVGGAWRFKRSNTDARIDQQSSRR